jgi:hypothetical protein
MQSLCRTTDSDLPGSPGKKRNVRHSRNHCANDSRRRQGFLCSAKGNSDFSRLWGAIQGSVWRGGGSIRLGTPEYSLHAGYLSGGITALRQADAGVASRRLRRHDDPVGSDADVNGTSSQTRAGGLSTQQASCVQSHLSRGKYSRTLDRHRRHSAPSHGLGSPNHLETDL